MNWVLAALDGGAASRPVLETAIAIADVTGTDVRAVHVARDRSDTARHLAERYSVGLRTLHGPVDSELLRAINDDEVLLAVLGARRTPGGRQPCGHTAMRMLTSATKPIVVVPPEMACGERRVRRVLLPLEGDAVSSQPVRELLYPLLRDDVELIVMHVFTLDTAPRLLDHPARDLSLWGDEFIARHCPPARHISLHTGPVGASVVDVADELAVDLVALSWSRTMHGGHAAVVREVLGRSSVPVLLLPVPARPTDTSSTQIERWW